VFQIGVSCVIDGLPENASTENASILESASTLVGMEKASTEYASTVDRAGKCEYRLCEYGICEY
jgi:hypothetical protein